MQNKILSILAVNQNYTTKAEDEYVIRGNDVLLKCKIPSFVSDYVTVEGWIDNEHNQILPQQIVDSKKISPNQATCNTKKKDFKIKMHYVAKLIKCENSRIIFFEKSLNLHSSIGTFLNLFIQ